MAETAVSFVLQQSFPFVVEEGRLLTGFERDFKEIKNELESIQALLKDADTKAAEEGGRANKEVKAWTKQLREESFRIEDVIDYYNMNVAQRVNHSGLIALLKNIFHMIPTLKSLYHVASEIRDIKLSVAGIKKRSTDFDFQSENGSSSSRGIKAARFVDPEIASYFNEQVVGFESQRDELVRCLLGGTSERMLVSVVGMGGLGKTTLAKYVFDKLEVKNQFDCRFYILASQSNTANELLIDMIKKLYEDSNEPIPEGLKEMHQIKLTTHVRKYLKSKRYLMWFDDVQKEEFADGIEHALIKNNTGSRIIVTTRMMHVAEYFKKSFHVHVHKLQPLPPNKAWELFCMKAFRGPCPTELEDISNDIVKKCGGLPLAIVVIGGLLSTKAKIKSEWRKVSQNLMELDGNVHFTRLTMILSRSYDDLPCHLKLCMLYFGIYPEHYIINCKRLTRQWIAEGFVMCDEGKTLEEVAEEYLKELIYTSLVQVSSVGFDGKVKSCRVHDLLHHIIFRKMKDESFCHIMYEDQEQVTVGITRRFSIVTFSHNVLRNNNNSGIRAIFVFDNREMSKYFIDSLSVKFKFVKVLDFEHSLLNYVPENLGNLLNLKYLNLSHTKVMVLPRSIGNLPNLETLDLRQTQVVELPMEINKLTKLRLLSVYYKKYEGHCSMLNCTTGAQMQKGIGCLKSLQNLYFLEAGCGGVDLIQELKKLSKLRKLGIRGVRGTYGNAICTAVQEMINLESLNITAITEEEILDLDFVSAPPYLRVLNLKARLTKVPDWIPKLEYIVKLVLSFCKFEHDPLDSLKNLPNLMRLILWDDAFAGESLHFKGGFPMLKELDLTRLNRLSSVSIDRDALLGLEHFRCNNIPELKVLPEDLQNLKNLQFLGFADMPVELVDSIDREKDGGCHWIINHIPLVLIREKVGSSFHEYEWRHIPTQLNV